MKKIIFVFLCAFISQSIFAQRQIAITFDDLVFVPNDDIKQIQTLTKKLLTTLKKNKVPAIGFVNEGKLNKPNEFEARTAILKMWIDAGFELGNHTYSHIDMFKATAEEFQADLLSGEVVTKKLLANQGKQERYFRHPFLNTGASPEKKSAFDKIIADNHYTVAPVSVDNGDYIFAAVYSDALKKNDRELMKRISDAYIPYMDSVLNFYEKQSKTLLGYELKQILLVHANTINADHFGAMIQMMKKRGYDFISLEEALRDKAYQLPDSFTGRNGTSWIQRWAMTNKHQPTIKQFKEEPNVPEFIQKAYDSRGK
jgi:peptidoglycan-N-acetylglucosamine deacetylase